MYKHINIYVNKHENFKLLFNIKENNASYVLQKEKKCIFCNNNNNNNINKE